MTRHRITAARRADGGYTVSEVMITLLILSIVLVIVLNFLIHATDITARTESNSRTETSAQLALRELTAELRAMDPASVSTCAAPLSTSANNCITFTIKRNTSGLSPCPKTQVTMALVGSTSPRQIRVNRQEYASGPSCPGAPTSTTTRTVLDKVVNNLAASPAENLFTYYAGDGSVLNPAAAGFTFASVDSLKLGFFVSYRNNAQRLDFRSVVALRNNNDR